MRPPPAALSLLSLSHDGKGGNDPTRNAALASLSNALLFHSDMTVNIIDESGTVNWIELILGVQN